MMKKSICIAAALSIVGLVSQVQAGTKCYGLAFGSGDQSASYEVGVLDSLLKKMPSDQTQYNYVTGVSGGAVNALLLASQGLGAERTAVNNMRKFWIDAGNTTLYSEWLIGEWAALLYAKGIWNSDPLKAFIQSELKTLGIN
jgi:predicted acylesterase/phospholipase RssA